MSLEESNPTAAAVVARLRAHLENFKPSRPPHPIAPYLVLEDELMKAGVVCFLRVGEAELEMYGDTDPEASDSCSLLGFSVGDDRTPYDLEGHEGWQEILAFLLPEQVKQNPWVVEEHPERLLILAEMTEEAARQSPLWEAEFAAHIAAQSLDTATQRLASATHRPRASL